MAEPDADADQQTPSTSGLLGRALRIGVVLLVVVPVDMAVVETPLEEIGLLSTLGRQAEDDQPVGSWLSVKSMTFERAYPLNLPGFEFLVVEAAFEA